MNAPKKSAQFKGGFEFFQSILRFEFEMDTRFFNADNGPGAKERDSFGSEARTLQSAVRFAE
jgi:hypothetical protein